MFHADPDCVAMYMHMRWACEPQHIGIIASYIIKVFLWCYVNNTPR